MRNTLKTIMVLMIAVILSSCYALEDDGVVSNANYQVVVHNGLPHYRNGRIDYYYYNSFYYYPYNTDGGRCWKRYTRPLPPPRRMRPPQRNFDRRPSKPQRFNKHKPYERRSSFGNLNRR